jgi:hypothetical protein
MKPVSTDIVLCNYMSHNAINVALEKVGLILHVASFYIILKLETNVTNIKIIGYAIARCIVEDLQLKLELQLPFKIGTMLGR